METEHVLFKISQLLNLFSMHVWNHRDGKGAMITHLFCPPSNIQKVQTAWQRAWHSNYFMLGPELTQAPRMFDLNSCEKWHFSLTFCDFLCFPIPIPVQRPQTHTQKNKCIQPYVKYIDGLLKGETIICNAAGFNYSIFFKLFRANELIPK